MAEELKKQFQEMHEAKYGKKDEIQVDEFEWIEVGWFKFDFVSKVNNIYFVKLNKQLAVDRETGKRHQETANEKLIRKFKENPLIPIGGLLTIGFLTNGLFKFGRRDSAGSQVMMRGRIAAQVRRIQSQSLSMT